MACILVTRELGDSSFPGARRQLRGRHGTASGRLLFEPAPDLYGVVNIKILGYEHYCFGHNSGYFKVLKAIGVDSRRIGRTFNYSFRLRRLSDYSRVQTHLQLIDKISWIYRWKDGKVGCKAKSRTSHALVFPAATSSHIATLSARPIRVSTQPIVHRSRNPQTENRSETELTVSDKERMHDQCSDRGVAAGFKDVGAEQCSLPPRLEAQCDTVTLCGPRV